MTNFIPTQPAALPFILADFEAITPAYIRENAAAGMAALRAEWDAIASNPEPPTIENTLIALGASGMEFETKLGAGYTMMSSIGGEEWDAVQAELMPQISALYDSLWMNDALYARLDALEVPEDPETARLLSEYLKDFRLRGIALGEDERAKLTELNAAISSGETEFEQRTVKARDDAALHITDPAKLAGLDQETLDSLAQSAADRGLEGWLITLISPTQQPLLTRLTDPETRAALLAASESRGDDDETRALVLKLARLRAEKARLLGFETHADLVVADATAPSAEAVAERLDTLAPPTVRNVTKEATALAELKARDSAAPFAPSDWFFYEEKLRTEVANVDFDAVRPYLELDAVLNDGVFYAATQLFGLQFTERPELTGWAPEVRVWEVRDEDGEPLALFVGDYYARPGKNGGAWMHNLVEQSHEDGTLPVIANNLNVTKPAPGKPTLLTWDETTTAFHEFGHALHGMLSNARFRGLAGTNVPRDFVEYPSQVNEMWLEDRDVVTHFARHHVTGEPLPDELLDSLLAVRSFGQGFATAEYLSAAIVDQAWHRLAPDAVPTDPAEVLPFEQRVLEECGLTVVPPRYRTTYFAHAFGGGYDANYYSYIWSEVLDADTQKWFRENGELNAVAGHRFRETVLSRGNTRDPLDSFRELVGHEPDLEPLLKRRNLL
ncbi:peptidyl-dipeptidase Dcp [Ruaniaceae bacterium KH17]|nr:peptidyl-dipeptidase Dcp [Ruaniaceae bacterium KH17]